MTSDERIGDDQTDRAAVAREYRALKDPSFLEPLARARASEIRDLIW